VDVRGDSQSLRKTTTMKTPSITNLVSDLNACYVEADLWDEPENDTQEYTVAVEIPVGSSMVSIVTLCEHQHGFVVVSARREFSHIIIGLSTPEQYLNHPV